jgi:hypothetical protein
MDYLDIEEDLYIRILNQLYKLYSCRTKEEYKKRYEDLQEFPQTNSWNTTIRNGTMKTSTNVGPASKGNQISVIGRPTTSLKQCLKNYKIASEKIIQE